MPVALPLTAPDVACVDDLDLFGRDTSSDLETLEQDVYHLLIEDPGSNPDDLNRGIGAERILSGSTTALATIAQTIDSELQKDDRIQSAKSTLSKLPAGSRLPDGTLLPDGGYLLEVDIVASSGVLGLSYSFTAAGGLNPA